MEPIRFQGAGFLGDLPHTSHKYAPGVSRARWGSIVPNYKGCVRGQALQQTWTIVHVMKGISALASTSILFHGLRSFLQSRVAPNQPDQTGKYCLQSVFKNTIKYN